MSEKRIDIVVGGKDAGGSAALQGVGQEMKKVAAIERTLADARKEYLTDEAAAGNVAAEVELKKLGIARDYAAQRERISAILKSEAADAEQRYEAQTLLVRLAEREAEAMERVRRDATAAAAGPTAPQDAHVAAFAEEKQFREWLANDKREQDAAEREFQTWLAQQRKQEADVARGIAQSREQALRNEVDAGNKAAVIELERLEVSKAYAAQHALIEDLLKAEMVTEEQALELQARRVQLAEQEAAALKRVGQPQPNDKGGLFGLKAALGEESEAGLALKAIRGAGAIAVVGLGTQMLDRASEKAAELSKELREGHRSGEEIAEDFLRSVPLLGNIYNTARSLAEVVLGVDADLESTRHQAELIDKAIGGWRENLRQSKRDHEELLDTIRQIRHEADVLALPQGQRADAAAAFAAGDRSRTVAKGVRDKIEAAEQKTAADIRPLQDELNKTPVTEAVTRGNGDYGSEDNYAAVEADQQKRAELQRQIDALNKQLRNSTAGLRKDLADTMEQIARAAALAYVDRLKSGFRDAVDAARDGSQAVADATTQARAEELRSLGKDLDAELLLIRANRDKEIAEIERKRQEAAKANGNPEFGVFPAALETKGAQARAEDAELAAQHAAGAAATERQKEEQSRADAAEQRSRDADDFIRQQKRASDEAAAAAGHLNKVELDRNKIADDYLERRKQILATMAQEGLTLDQRAKLGKQFRDLDGEESEAKRRAVLSNAAGGPLFASAEDTRLGGDYFQARDDTARDVRESPEVKATNDAAKSIVAAITDALPTAVGEAFTAALSAITSFGGGGSPAPSAP